MCLPTRKRSDCKLSIDRTVTVWDAFSFVGTAPLLPAIFPSQTVASSASRIIAISASKFAMAAAISVSAFIFLTYTKRINKAYNRTGSLFEYPFERRIIENENYLKECIVYIQNNPVKDGYAVSAAEYKWSSYNAIISDKPTLIKREHVLNLFGDVEKFHYFHGVFEKNV